MGDDEDNDFLKTIANENEDLKSKNVALNTALSSATYQAQEDSNLIEYQLDTGDMLNKIEHFLRGERIVTDTEGNEFWGEQKNQKLVLFNDYGVNSIMAIIGNYIDKNTILSLYDEMRINEILADLGDELANFIYCNYEVMGMDTNFKKTRFILTVITILHSIESTYRRAINGKTFQELNTSSIFTQLDNRAIKSPINEKKKFNLFKPNTW